MKRNMHIAMLCPGYPSSPEDYRGPFVKTMVDHLKTRGYRITVITPQVFRSNPAYLRVDDREEIFRFPFWTEGKVLPEYKRIPYVRMVTYFASGVYHSAKIIKERGCDLIHAQFLVPTGVLSTLVKILTGKPMILTVHGPEAAMALESRLLSRLARWTFKHTAYTTTVADHVTQKCGRLGMKPGQYVKIPMGIDEEVFWRPEEELTSAGRKRIIVSTRSFVEPQYNMVQLIEALPVVFGRDLEATCLLAGDGPERAPLESRVRELGVADRVTFVGKQSPEQIAAMLRQAMVYVSTSRFDGASVSLFEAMAQGAFPVVTDMDANREWITQGENGFLAKLEDPGDLAEQILTALNNPDLREKVMKINQKTIEDRVLWSKSISRFEEVYHRVLS